MADHPNVVLMRNGYEAFAKGDLDAVRDFFAEDIVWHVPGNNMLSGEYKGQDAVFGFFGTLIQETGGTFRQEIHDVLANDTHGVALVEIHLERGGKTFEGRGVHAMHIEDGKVTEFWNFQEDTTLVDEFWS
jgi:uncharacterized protein